MEEGIGRKGPLDGRTPSLTGTWEQVEDGKGGGMDVVRQAQARARNYLGRPAWEGSADERWRPAGEGDVHVDGRSATGRNGWGRSRCKEMENRHQRVIYGGSIEDKSGGGGGGSIMQFEQGGAEVLNACKHWHQSLGPERSLSEVGTPPPHDYDTLYGLVSGNTHTKR